jgi:predicted secreted Zn-dependent protease
MENRVGIGDRRLALALLLMVAGQPASALAQEVQPTVAPDATPTAVVAASGSTFPLVERESAPVPPEGVDATIDFSYQPYSGQTLQDLNRQGGQIGFLENGQRYFAQTSHELLLQDPEKPKDPPQHVPFLQNYRIEWRVGKGCWLDSVRVIGKSLITIPQWKERSLVPVFLQTRVDEFTDALINHEYGHVRNYYQILDRVYRKLKTLQGFSSCDDLEARVKKDSGDIYFSELPALDQNYDQQTNHGMTQQADIALYYP